MRRTALAALVLAAGTAGAQPAAGPERSTAVVRGDLGRKLDEYLSRLETLGYSGGLAVLKGGETVLLKGYGQADREGGIPMRPDSVFNLGSITKPFTAAAILRLQELGKLKTSDPVSRFFEGVPEDKAGITLEHLLTHSSGLESDFSPTDYERTTREEYVRRALASKLLFPPGQGYEYANAGYSLLAAVIEQVSGQDYETALRELVLKPAGMTETGYKAPRWDKARIAHGYRGGEDWGTILGRIEEPGAPYWALRGNGGLHTTLADMVRWDAALRTDAVLTAASRESYFRPRVAEGPRAQSHYAFGWAIEKTPHGTLVQHNGGNGPAPTRRGSPSRPAPSRRGGATFPSPSGSSWLSASMEAAALRGASRSRTRTARPSSSSRARTAPCACPACPDGRRRLSGVGLHGAPSPVATAT